jgi:mannan endo-1,4-beta-mannosidase
MTLPPTVSGFLLALAFTAACAAAEPDLRPVTPGASPEAVELYGFLRQISGKQTIAGQHAAPLVGMTQLGSVYKRTGRYPAIFGQDFGFSEPGTWDGINYRQRLVDEAIRRHEEGFIIVLMWHAVRPIDDEPVDFKTSVQGSLTDAQWKDLVTPGTLINERWKSQVDVVAWHLRQLRDAHVPVLWRPYHEMNGDWFWWGNRPGENGSRKLYRMLYDRLVNFHHLNNLLWIFGGNEMTSNAGPYAQFYPGADVVDVVATDVYKGAYKPDYDALLALAGGKPIALAEVGKVPPIEILQAEPRWTWFMTWGELGPYGDTPRIRAVYGSDRVLTWDKLPWVKNPHPTVHYPVLY